MRHELHEYAMRVRHRAPVQAERGRQGVVDANLLRLQVDGAHFHLDAVHGELAADVQPLGLQKHGDELHDRRLARRHAILERERRRKWGAGCAVDAKRLGEVEDVRRVGHHRGGGETRPSTTARERSVCTQACMTHCLRSMCTRRV